MKKNIKLAFVGLLALALTFGFVSCDDGSKSESTAATLKSNAITFDSLTKPDTAAILVSKDVTSLIVPTDTAATLVSEDLTNVIASIVPADTAAILVSESLVNVINSNQSTKQLQIKIGNGNAQPVTLSSVTNSSADTNGPLLATAIQTAARGSTASGATVDAGVTASYTDGKITITTVITGTDAKIEIFGADASTFFGTKLSVTGKNATDLKIAINGGTVTPVSFTGVNHSTDLATAIQTAARASEVTGAVTIVQSIPPGKLTIDTLSLKGANVTIAISGTDASTFFGTNLSATGKNATDDLKIAINGGTATAVNFTNVSNADTLAAAIQTAARASEGTGAVTKATNTSGVITIDTDSLVGANATIEITGADASTFFGANTSKTGTVGGNTNFTIKGAGAATATVSLSSTDNDIEKVVAKINTALSAATGIGVTVDKDGINQFVLTTTAKGKDAKIEVGGTDVDTLFATKTIAGKD